MGLTPAVRAAPQWTVTPPPQTEKKASRKPDPVRRIREGAPIEKKTKNVNE